MISEIMKKEIAIQEKQEKELLGKIKTKMEEIKAVNQRLPGGAREPKDHYDGKIILSS